MRGRLRVACRPPPSARAFQYRHADSSCSDGGIASIAARTSGHAPARKRRANAPCALRIGQRRIAGLAEPFGGQRVLLPRRVEGDPRIAVESIGFGQLAALLLPRGANARGVGPRGALERVEREIASARLLPPKFALRERGPRVRVDVREFPERDPIVGRHVDRDRLREANVAGFGRQAEARATIVDGHSPLARSARRTTARTHPACPAP